MLYLIAIVIVLVSIFLVLKNRNKENHFDKFPEPPGKFFFGHVLEARYPTNILKVFTKFINDHGTIVKLRLGPFLTGILTTDHKLLEFILSSNQILTKAQNYLYVRDWLGRGLLVSDGSHWKTHRKILTPAFHFEILKTFVETFESVGNIFIEKLGKCESSSVDVHPIVSLCTLDIICETAMGTQINALKGENSQYVKNVKKLCRILIDRCLSPLKVFNWTYWMTQDFYTQKTLLKNLHGFTTDVINVRKRTQNGIQISKKAAFLDLLLKYANEGELLDDNDIREEVDTFMFEGHDTTASSISFALYCLANYPEIQAKVLQEQKDLFGDDQDPLITYQELQNMKYLELVIKETLRLYPAAPIVGRYTTEDLKFEDRVIPKNTNIALFIYGIHRNPEYFPDPEKFNPDRFKNCQNLPPYAYIPFSAGPRNCIGQKFAMLELKSTISKVVRHFELTAASPHHDLMLSVEGVLKSVNGITVGLRKRIKY